MILDIENASRIAKEEKAKGKIIVTTNGCFDILHVGHVRCIHEAKNLGDILIVGVNSDRSKGVTSKPGRPIVPGIERAELVDSLKPVDYVFLFDDETPISWIRKIKPDVHVKAADSSYGIEQCVERFAVQENSGKVVLLPKTSGKSTTNIISKVLETYG